MPALQQQAHIEDNGQVSEELAAAVAWHDGDKDATIITLLDDCRHLRLQLALTEGSMSVGFSRGWRPSPDRQSSDQA
jgi:hypothetical protein